MTKKLWFVFFLSFLMFGLTGCGRINTLSISENPLDVTTINSDIHLPTFTISYDAGEGEELESFSATEGSIIILPIPSREGYSFSGWFLDNITYINAFDSPTMPAENITLYARWTINQYTVEFIDHNGTVLQTANYDYGASLSSVTAPTNPTRIGYTFVTWIGTVPLSMGSSKVTLMATYTLNQYTVEYVDHDGTVLQTANYDYGYNLSCVTPPLSPTRTGYTFKNWSGTIPATMGITKITITAIYSNIEDDPKDYSFFLKTDGTYELTGYLGNQTILIIPSIYMGKTVTSIGSYAFHNRTNVTSITIPSSVISIGASAFIGCSGLTSIILPFVGANRTATGSSAVFGYIFGYTSYPGGSSTQQYYETSSFTNYYIPSTLRTVNITDATTLQYGAFYGCSGLTSITISSSVTSIGAVAFAGCDGLTSFITPSNVTSISGATFWGCSKLTNITISSNVTIIGSAAFEGCSSLTSITIPSRVTIIGDRAFTGCIGLSSITIPSSVTIMYDSAFHDCSGLTSFTFDTGSQLTSINGGTFSGCKGLTSITIPSSVIIIGGGAFSGCSGLTSITIPSSVTYIGSAAFSGCSGLTSITIPSSVTIIGDRAFSGCSGLTSITIPSSVTRIGYWAFTGCSGLTSITLPFVGASRTGAGYSAVFGYIFGTYSYTGSTATTQYYESSSYKTYYIPTTLHAVVVTDATNLPYGAFYGCRGLTSITIPSSVTSIGFYAFNGCTGLTSITIPSGVISIDGRAFSGCSELKSIIIPSSVTSIGVYSFYGCSGLTSITIPSSVTSIGMNAFYLCSSLTIYTPLFSQPSGWDINWNSGNRPVVWGIYL